MSKLIAVISPAKLLDDKTHYPEIKCTQPAFLKEAETLVSKLKKLKGKELSELMDISSKLGEENKVRYTKWSLPFTHANSHPSILMFKGEVYRGMKAETFNKKQLEVAQEKLRILSGLYGLLRPMDLVMPYRLMMGTPFSPNAKTKSLYAFWGDKISKELNKIAPKSSTIVNLASSEYFKAVDPKTLSAKVITCEFRQKKGNKFEMIGTYAKLARGMMARYIIEHDIDKVEDIKSFDTEKYAYNEALSTKDLFVFTRDQPPLLNPKRSPAKK
ncbi:MAG: peroxide stress protein YaaA [Flavobacteriales bacterium]